MSTGLNGYAFARKGNMSEGYVSRVETGCIGISVSCVEKFALGCGLSTHEFVDIMMDEEGELARDPFLSAIAPLVRNLSPTIEKLCSKCFRICIPKKLKVNVALAVILM